MQVITLAQSISLSQYSTCSSELLVQQYNKLSMKQPNIPSLLVLKWLFRISKGGIGSAVKLSTWDLKAWQKEEVLHKRGF